jgi:peptidoglycan hydrolase-like protein with peptidoglycan-binding domain
MRLNQKGLSHHLILPVIVVLAVGSIGAYILNRSGATGGCSSNTYSQGSSGACVAELQRLTNKCVAAKGAGAAISADGAFGPITKSAVIRCQQASGIGADGIVGPQTWRVLDSYASAAPASAPAAAPALSAEQTCAKSTFGQGANGSCVTILQQKVNGCLAAAGNSTRIATDGAFGQMTKNAVIACQQANGIGADGIVGPQTWGVLLKKTSVSSTANVSQPAPTASSVSAPVAPTASSSCTNSALSQGANGSCVTQMQQKVNGCLAAIGSATRIATDGAFGQMTKNAVIACQQANGIGADGIVGPQTWGVLMKYGSVSSAGNSGAPAAPAATGNSAKSAGASSSSSSVLATQQRINACLRSKGISLRIAEDGVWGPQSQAGQNACNQGLTPAQESKEARQTAAANRQSNQPTYTAAKTSSQQRAEATAEKKAIVAEKKQSFVQKYINQPAKTMLEKITGPISAWIID